MQTVIGTTVKKLGEKKERVVKREANVTPTRGANIKALSHQEGHDET